MALSDEGKEAIQDQILTLREKKKALIARKQTLISEFEKAKKLRDELLAEMDIVNLEIANLQGDLL